MADGGPGKTLAFSFDGTGNEPGDAGGFQENESVSNVLKLHVLMEGGLEERPRPTRTKSRRDQRAYYYNGIGARDGAGRMPLLGWLASAVNRAVAPTFGDAGRILDEAMEDFEGSGYEPGDKLAVFGFSRGAALARKFAARLLAEDERRTVSFLGAFDTVAAMNGVHRKGERTGSDVVFENGTLNPRIERAVHLVSIDEDRVAFTPTLINKDGADGGRILEVWFPGVHSDVGGGYWFDGLSDLALAFMIGQCRRALGDDVALADGDDPAGLRKLLDGHREDALAGLEVDDIAVHPLVDGVVHAHTGIQAALFSQAPRSIHVCDGDRPSPDPDDLPLLHHSVKRRFEQVADYRPSALRGLAFRLLLDGDGRISAPIHGISGLRACELPDS